MSTTKIHIHQLGDRCTVEAWEPIVGPTSGHGTISSTMFGGEWHGLITSRALPAEIEALEPGVERMSKAIDHHAACVAEALAAIEAAHPGILHHPGIRIDGGRVEFTGDLEPMCQNCGQRQSVNPALWVEVDGLGFCWQSCADQHADPAGFAAACRVR